MVLDLQRVCDRTIVGDAVAVVSVSVEYSNAISNPQTDYKGCPFGDVTCSAAIGAAAKVLLRSLALLPDEGATAADYEGDYMYWNHNTAERCVYRGGAWSDGAGAGVFYLVGGNARSHSDTNIGFRPAFIPEVIG